MNDDGSCQDINGTSVRKEILEEYEPEDNIIPQELTISTCSRNGLEESFMQTKKNDPAMIGCDQNEELKLFDVVL